MIHSGMLYRLDIFTFYFYGLAVSDCLAFEIYKNLGSPLYSNVFAVSSHADNHFYKYIYAFQILYSIKSAFLIKYFSIYIS